MTEEKTIHVKVCGFTDVGPKRVDNQDVIMANGMVGLGSHSSISFEEEVKGALSIAVVDGMGGYSGGADAAALAASYLAARHLPGNSDDANSLFERLDVGIAAAGSAWATPKMGATVAMLTLRGESVLFANVGDCRIYRVFEKNVELISVDDRFRNSTHIVTQSLGQVRKLDVHFREEPLRTGNTRFALCSDGVWSTLDDASLDCFLRSEDPLSEVLSALRDKLYSRLAKDNISFVIIDVEVS